jgi:hypothetical protein
MSLYCAVCGEIIPNPAPAEAEYGACATCLAISQAVAQLRAIGTGTFDPSDPASTDAALDRLQEGLQRIRA